MDAFHHHALVIGLEGLQRHAQFTGQPLQGRVDVGQGGMAVMTGVAFAEHVEIDAVEDEDLVHGIPPDSGARGAS